MNYILILCAATSERKTTAVKCLVVELCYSSNNTADEQILNKPRPSAIFLLNPTNTKGTNCCILISVHPLSEVLFLFRFGAEVPAVIGLKLYYTLFQSWHLNSHLQAVSSQ